MGTSIIAMAILLAVGYVIISRIVGLAFRLVVPVVLILILGGAGIFSGLMPNHTPDRYAAEQDRFADGGSRLGDVRLRDIGDTVLDAVRSTLRGALTLFDTLAAREPADSYPRYSDPRHSPRDVFDEAPPGPSEEPSWEHSIRPGRAY